MVRKRGLAPEMSIKLCASYSDGSENTRRTRHAIATRLLTAVVGITRARNFTCITYILFRHRARYIHHHVIVLFDIIVEQINFLGGADLTSENYVFTCQTLIDGYLILPRMFLEFDYLGNSAAFSQGNTRLREQLLYCRTYLSTFPVCFIIWVFSTFAIVIIFAWAR